MDWMLVLILFGSFVFFLNIGTPIAVAIGISSLLTIGYVMPIDIAATVVAQKLATGLDSFSLLTIPFFILAGNIMNQGGIAARLIEFAKLIGGFLPGALTHINIISNMLFGSISGSAVASAAAVGSIMGPAQKKQGYKPEFSAAANISSCASGLLIPPSNGLIIFALVSGGTSLSALFVAGYLPGILMGLGLMLVSGIIAKKNNYPVIVWPGHFQAFKTVLAALPAIAMVVLIMGGIIAGIFTATEASAIAVIYALFLSLLVYREISFSDLPNIMIGTIKTSAMVLFLIGASMSMSWAMAIADLPQAISDSLLTLTENKLLLLLLINLILLVIGIFMDLTPALLIFTPILLPVATKLGIDPVHFGIMMTFNLSIGICTPPVGSALFVGSAVANLKIQQVIKPLLPFYFVLLVLLVAVITIPDISLFLPRLLLGYGS